MRVRYTPRARNDLRDILEYLDERSPKGASNVERVLQNTLKLIEQFPESGRLAGEQGVRVLPVGRYPYLVYRQITAGEAWIVHIRHAARKPWDPRQ
jgi:toxin ParE1/3/4